VLQYLAGDIESVYAHCGTMGHERIEVEDAAVATLRFKNGAIGTLVGTTCAFPGLSTRIEVFGKDGSAVIENDLLVHEVFRDDIGEVGNYGSVSQLEPKEEVNETGASEPAAILLSSHVLQFKDLIEAIEENREPKVNGIEAIKPLKVIMAIYQSSKIGEQVQIDEI
jgi:predicted dehydrogenase